MQNAPEINRENINRFLCPSCGDEQRVHDISTNFSNVTFKHLLLPVYAGAYRFNAKTYQIVVNGRTGKVQGERSYSWIKITLFVLTLLIMLIILVAIFGGRR
ncbi:MAG: hypothetical protein ACR2L1_06100 [Pyrinomonadaceae bacterium]